MIQLSLFENLGDDPARQPYAESARLLARLDNAKRYFRAQQDQRVALQAEVETLKAAMAHIQEEIATLKSANAQLQADLEHSRELNYSHLKWEFVWEPLEAVRVISYLSNRSSKRLSSFS